MFKKFKKFKGFKGGQELPVTISENYEVFEGGLAIMQICACAAEKTEVGSMKAEV